MEIKKAPIYLDTNFFIYMLEAHEDYKAALKSILDFKDRHGLITFTSEITLAECLVKPFTDGNAEAVKVYESQIKTGTTLKVKSVSRKILRESAKLRGELGLKLPDAIHVATALENGCATFVTNDKKLRVPEGMTRIYLKEFEFPV